MRFSIGSKHIDFFLHFIEYSIHNTVIRHTPHWAYMPHLIFLIYVAYEPNDKNHKKKNEQKEPTSHSIYEHSVCIRKARNVLLRGREWGGVG